MTQTTELKPCPFCGAQLEVSQAFSTRGNTVYVHPVCDELCVGQFVIGSSDAQRVEAWNRRSTAALHTQEDEALEYAENLANSLAEKHFPENTDWKPLSGDLTGILTQIDNMTSGLSRSSLTLQSAEPELSYTCDTCTYGKGGKCCCHPSQSAEPVDDDDLPFRRNDIKRGLILFRTSNNAHGYTNFVSLTSKVDALPQEAKDELATIMRNIAEELSPLAHQPVTAGLVGEAQFLLDRLEDFERGMFTEDAATTYRDWCGHIQPPMARLRAALKSEAGRK